MIRLALVSLAGLALEITLTHLFSVLFFYNHVFLLISLAILGLGVGVGLVHQRAFPQDPEQLEIRPVSLLIGFCSSKPGSSNACRCSSGT